MLDHSPFSHRVFPSRRLSEPHSNENPVWHIVGRLETAWFSELRGCWLAQCPLDAVHVLSLSRGEDGCAVLECLDGCDWDEVRRALGLGVFDLAGRYVRRPAAEACDDSSLEEAVAPRSEWRRAA
jgi:hypothetical protein